jgi:hypothetical protein
MEWIEREVSRFSVKADYNLLREEISKKIKGASKIQVDNTVLCIIFSGGERQYNAFMRSPKKHFCYDKFAFNPNYVGENTLQGPLTVLGVDKYTGEIIRVKPD